MQHFCQHGVLLSKVGVNGWIDRSVTYVLLLALVHIFSRLGWNSEHRNVGVLRPEGRFGSEELWGLLLFIGALVLCQGSLGASSYRILG